MLFLFGHVTKGWRVARATEHGELASINPFRAIFAGMIDPDHAREASALRGIAG
jgi:hypothetical protein